MIPADINHDAAIAEILHLANQAQVPVQKLQRGAFQKLAENRHQQVLARMRDIRHVSLKELIQKRPTHVMVLDHIEDPHNMGAIIRSCEAMGISAIIYPKQRSATLSTGVIRASAGAIWHVDLCQVSNIAQSLRQLKEADFWIYAASEHEGTPVSEVEPLTPAAIILGNEHKGLSTIVKKMVNFFVTIPLVGQVSSLNVSVAAGIIIYYMNQQKSYDFKYQKKTNFYLFWHKKK